MYMIRNYQNTFKRIIDNGILIISLYGYDKTSIRDISYKSKIKESTFYHYFESKIKLLIKIIDILEKEIDKLNVENLKKNNSYYYLQNKIIDMFKLFNNHRTNRIWRILNMESYSDINEISEKINNIKKKIKNYFKNILLQLQDNMNLKSYDIEIILNDLYNNVIYYINEFNEKKINEKNTSEIEEKLYTYLRYFWDKIKI